MLHDHITFRAHIPAGSDKSGHRIPCKSVLPLGTPTTQRRSQVLETLQRVEVRRQRNYHMLGSNQRRAIDCPQIGTYIDQDERRTAAG